MSVEIYSRRHEANLLPGGSNDKPSYL